MISSEDISVVVQGAINKKETAKCLNSIRKYFPEAYVILSTWEGTDISGLNCDKIILNKDPGGFKDKFCSTFTNNLLRQLISTQSAISNVSTKYVLKMRTDICFKSSKFLKYWNKFLKSDNYYKIYEHKIITSSFFFKRFLSDKKGTIIMPVPFHISDWFQFGLTNDIKKLYNIELPKEPNQSEFFYNNSCDELNENLLKCSHQYTPEQYIAYNSYKKHSNHTPVQFQHYMDFNNENVQESENFILNNFIILSPQEIGFICLKERTNNDTYTKWCKDPFQMPYILWNGLYRPYIYRVLYKQICDNKYKIPLKIILKELLEKIIIARGKKCIVLW